MSYYDNQESVANIAIGLMERDWKVYGYKGNESDPYTDYWSPARWCGIAEKNGFILLVDVYNNHESGYKVTKTEYTPDYSKIEKLQATINDKAASQNEKEVAQKIIDKMKEKKENSEVVVSEYPTFSQGNPKGCNWHIEKDGNIIAKGKGAFQCDGYLFGGYEDETMKKVNDFIDKIESKIIGSEQLEVVQQKVIKKVVKPVEVETKLNNFVKDVTIIKLNSSFTGGHYKGELLQLVDTYEFKGNTRYTFVRLGKKYQQLKRYGAANNTLLLVEGSLEKWLENGTITTMELKEVEEVTYKTVYKKVSRKGQESNLLETELNETEEQTQETTLEATESSITFETGTGSKGNGIEITFTSKPSEEVRNAMKAVGFRWAGKNRPTIWWAVSNEERLALAEKLASVSSTEAHNSEVVEETEQQETEQEFSFIPEVDTMEFDLQYFSETATTDDILNAFDNIDLTNDSNSVITAEDREHCEQLEKEYSQAQSLYNTLLQQLEAIQKDNQYIDNYSDINPIKERLERLKNSFISNVVYHFKNKYSIEIDYYKLEKKYKNLPITLEILLDEIISLLDGLTFSELEFKQLSNRMKDHVNSENVSVKASKITIPSYFWVTSENLAGLRHKLSYTQSDKVNDLFKTISHYNNVNYSDLNQLKNTIQNEYNEDVFTTHSLNLTKINEIKLYKNGKVDIVFNSSEYAKTFFNSYLQN